MNQIKGISQTFKQINKLSSLFNLSKGTPKSYFGAATHDHDHGHDHHAHEIVLNQTNSLLGNADLTKEFVALNGWKDINDDGPHPDIDPYDHLRDKPLISFEKMYFADPYFHSDDHEPLMNEPHGYLTMDDPMDQRHTFQKAGLEYTYFFVFAVGAGLFLGYQTLNYNTAPSMLFDANLTADLIETELKQIREQNYALQARKAQLLEELSQK